MDFTKIRYLFSALNFIQSHCIDTEFCMDCPLSVRNGSVDECGLATTPANWNLVDDTTIHLFKEAE